MLADPTISKSNHVMTTGGKCASGDQAPNSEGGDKSHRTGPQSDASRTCTDLGGDGEVRPCQRGGERKLDERKKSRGEPEERGKEKTSNVRGKKMTIISARGRT